MVSDYSPIKEGNVWLKIEPRRGDLCLVRQRRRAVDWDQAGKALRSARLNVGIDAINTSCEPLSVRFEEFSVTKPPSLLTEACRPRREDDR